MRRREPAAESGVGEDELRSRALLISIQPRFAHAILEGSKTIELRRTFPSLEPGALALIYSSSPTKAVVGWANVETVITAKPSTLWRTHRLQTGVTAAEFRGYFEGSDTAYGLKLRDVTAAPRRLDLDSVRAHGLEPPQSWRYLSHELAERLRREMSGTAPTPPRNGILRRLCVSLST